MMLNIKNKNGAVSIPLVMGIGILLFLIVISMTSVETARIYVVQAEIDGTQATEYAKSGLRDALENIARDPSFGTTTILYEIDMKEDGCKNLKYCTKISVSPIKATTTGRIIGTLGYYKSAIKGMEAIVNYDANDYGEIKLIKTKETMSPYGLSQ